MADANPLCMDLAHRTHIGTIPPMSRQYGLFGGHEEFPDHHGQSVDPVSIFGLRQRRTLYPIPFLLTIRGRTPGAA